MNGKLAWIRKTRVKPSFRYFCRFTSGSLTLRPRKKYVYVFRALFGFWNFQATSCFLQKLGTYSFSSTLNLLSSLCAYTLQFVFPSLLKSAYKYWYYLLQRNYYKDLIGKAEMNKSSLPQKIRVIKTYIFDQEKIATKFNRFFLMLALC